MKRSGWLVVSVVGGLALGLAPRGGADDAGQAPTIDQRIEALEQEIQELKRLREQDQAEAARKEEAASRKMAEAPEVTAGMKGFSMRSGDGDFRLRMRGYTQADGRFYLDDRARNGTDTFLLRRARPILEGTVYRDFDFRLMADFGNGASSSAILQDAYLEWKSWPWLKVRAGKFKPPVGLEQLESDTELFFAERGLPSDLVPQRDVGLQLAGELFGGVIRYAGGVFNGVVDNSSADFDTWDSKDFAARVFLHPFKRTDLDPLRGFGFGVGGTIGNQHFGSSTNLPAYKTTGQLTFFSYSAGVVPEGRELRFTPQAYYFWGPFRLIGEYVISEQDLRQGATVQDRLRHEAWSVQGTFVLTGEDASYQSLVPRRPFDLRRGGWGAFEIAARYGDLRVDPAAFSPAPTSLRFADPTRSAQEARAWGVGLNWYLNRSIRLVLDYEETSFDGGAGSASPAAFTIRDRPRERLIITRSQISF